MNEKRDPSATNRVAVIGCRDLSAYDVDSLLSSWLIREVVLVGDLPEHLAGWIEISESGGRSNARCRRGNLADAANSDIVVIGADVTTTNSTGDRTVEDEVDRVRGISSELSALEFDGVLIATVGPIEMMLRSAEAGRLPSEKIIGLGRHYMHEVGVAVWCTGIETDVEFMDLCDPGCPYFQQVRKGVRRHSASAAGTKSGEVAVCVSRLCDEILSSRYSMIPLWHFGTDGETHFGSCVIGDRKILPTTTFESRATGPVQMEAA